MNPKKPKPLGFRIHEVILRDPLGDAARGERRNLLAASVIAILVARAGLVPKRIETLGIELRPEHQSRLFWAFLIVLLYFLVTFAVYAVADYLARVHEHVAKESAEISESNRQRLAVSMRESVKVAMAQSAGPQVIHERFPAYARYQRLSPMAATVRAIFEYVVPVALAVWAALELLHLALAPA